MHCKNFRDVNLNPERAWLGTHVKRKGLAPSHTFCNWPEKQCSYMPYLFNIPCPHFRMSLEKEVKKGKKPDAQGSKCPSARSVIMWHLLTSSITLSSAARPVADFNFSFYSIARYPLLLICSQCAHFIVAYTFKALQFGHHSQLSC